LRDRLQGNVGAHLGLRCLSLGNDRLRAGVVDEEGMITVDVEAKTRNSLFKGVAGYQCLSPRDVDSETECLREGWSHRRSRTCLAPCVTLDRAILCLNFVRISFRAGGGKPHLRLVNPLSD
jgi:hypothetical protein